jgi:ADP-L-glycero-D-manno-heptose 6-epimerase
MLDNGKVVVTGGAGFIGSALVWGLNRLGLDRILVVDRLDRSDKWRNLSPLRFDDYIEADDFAWRISRNAQEFGPVSAVLHLGACSSTTEADAAFLIRNNFEYSKQMALWSGVVNARFVYASSAATYGGIEGPVSEDLPPEDLRPLNAYAFSKQIFDLWAARAGVLQKAAGLKYFNVFGPNEAHKGEMRSMVYRAFQQIRQTGSVKLFRSERAEFKDGEQLRDFLYVKDAVAMTLHMASCPSAVGIFNLGSGVAHTWLDLTSPVFEACGQPPKVEFIDMPEQLRAKYQYHTCADIRRLRACGYDKEITALPAAVTDYVKSYLIPDLRLGDPMEAK